MANLTFVAGDRVSDVVAVAGVVSFGPATSRAGFATAVVGVVTAIVEKTAPPLAVEVVAAPAPAAPLLLCRRSRGRAPPRWSPW